MYNTIKRKLIFIVTTLLFSLIVFSCSNDNTTTTNQTTEEIELANYISQFDLSDEKQIWDGSVEDDFASDRILITLKKTSSYPEFKLKYLGIEEAISFEYLRGPLPPDYYFKDEYADYLDRFRQDVSIHLVPQEKERIIELVREIEKLEFVKLVSPSMIYELC